jgi:hypothetical protein
MGSKLKNSDVAGIIRNIGVFLNSLAKKGGFDP